MPKVFRQWVAGADVQIPDNFLQLPRVADDSVGAGYTVSGTAFSVENMITTQVSSKRSGRENAASSRCGPRVHMYRLGPVPQFAEKSRGERLAFLAWKVLIDKYRRAGFESGHNLVPVKVFR